MAESLDLGELERELNKYISYSRKKGIKRTLEGHLRAIRNWFKKAEEFKARDGADTGLLDADKGGVSVGSVNGGGGAGSDPLARRLAAYRSFQAKGMGEWYLECCCKPHERREIEGALGK
jgi:hypothetical protein